MGPSSVTVPSVLDTVAIDCRSARDAADTPTTPETVDEAQQMYQAYLERAYVLLRAGGLLMVDNVLWGGSVINPAKQDEDTEAMRNSVECLDDEENMDNPFHGFSYARTDEGNLW